MALRELRHPFWQAWGEREPAPAAQVPMPPQLSGWPERPPPRPRRPEDEIDDIVRGGSSQALERSTRAFFAQPMETRADEDAWLSEPPPPLPPGTRRAMYATIGLLFVGTLLIGGELIYHRIIMPLPVTLGHPAAPRLPSVVPAPSGLSASVPTSSPGTSVLAQGSDALRVLAPDAAESLVDLAWLNVRAGDPFRAYEYAQRATVADPSSEPAWAARERALEGLRDPLRARDSYRDCVSASPGPFGFACSRLLKR